MLHVSEPLLETPVPKGCSAVDGGGLEGAGMCGWLGRSEHQCEEPESFSVLARLCAAGSTERQRPILG